jgi:hypothetical protein
MTGIQTKYFLDTNQKHYHLNQLAVHYHRCGAQRVRRESLGCSDQTRTMARPHACVSHCGAGQPDTTSICRVCLFYITVSSPSASHDHSAVAHPHRNEGLHSSLTECDEHRPRAAGLPHSASSAPHTDWLTEVYQAGGGIMLSKWLWLRCSLKPA